MASISLASLVLAISLCALMASPAESQTCASKKFATSKKTFAHCLDLPVLSAILHYTYNAANNSLAVAFTAPPPKSDGWIAWAINPTGKGMAGAQAFVAAKRSNGSVPVTTFNISSYRSIVPGNLSFEVQETSAESAADTITIFAVVKVPAGKARSLNHLWQVGPGFNQSNGFLLKHEFSPDNLAAVGTLNLLGAVSAGPAGSPASSPSPALAPDSGVSTGGKSAGVSVSVSAGNLVLCTLALLVALVSLTAF